MPLRRSKAFFGWHVPLLSALALTALSAGVCGCASLLGSLPRGLSSVRGEVRFSNAGRPAPELGPVIVYLEREENAFRWPRPAARALYDEEARGDVGHELIVVARKGTVRFNSQGGVEHRLFAVRGRERIDVTVPAEGRSQRIRLVTPGLSRFYCSLHEKETRDVFVAPSSLFARLDPKGAYHIAHVPPGDYRLRIWSQPVEGTVKAIRVGLWTSAQETIWLDPARISP